MRLYFKYRGFTLIELVVILLIIGILAVTVVPRFFSPQSFSARSFYDQTFSMVRYAQKVAVAQRTQVQISLQSLDGVNSSVCLSYVSSSASCDVPNPAKGQPYIQAVPLDLTFQMQSRGESISSFHFDGLGKPSAGAILTIAGDDIKRTITVEAETGYVH